MRPAQWKSQTDLVQLRKAVLGWYASHGRELPWRRTTDPYPIWLAEIMLQQTQVATVIPHFERFLQRFPTWRDLARASQSDVLLAWQGLGYYRRATALHRAAQEIVNVFEGIVLDDVEILRSLPGLGRYTANAIACFAYDRRLPILEANTIRVWTRVCAAVGDPRARPLVDELWSLAEQVLPERQVPAFNQALMDIGATICRPRHPKCPLCPLAPFCEAREQGKVAEFPQPAKRRLFQKVEHVCAIVHERGKFLITLRGDSGPWANLWEFPRTVCVLGESNLQALWRALEDVTDRPPTDGRPFTTIRHEYMHYRVRLYCYRVTLGRRRRQSSDGAKRSLAPSRWASLDALEDLPFSSPQRVLIERLRNGEDT